MTSGTAASAKIVRLQTPGRRKNRHDERLQGRVVRRLHQRVDLRRLGRLRSADHHRRPRIRLRARPAGLDAGDEQGGAALSRASVSTDDADVPRGGLLHLESSRHHRMQRGRDRLRNHPARRPCSRQGLVKFMAAPRRSSRKNCRMPGQKAVTAPEPHFSIVPQIFRRQMRVSDRSTKTWLSPFSGSPPLFACSPLVSAPSAPMR